MSEKKVPEVRFRGFRGEWEVFKLGDLGICSGGTSIEAEFCSDGIYRVISIGSYSEDSTYREQGLRVKPNEKTLSRLLNKYDLTMVLNDKTASGRIIGRTLLIDTNDSYVYNQRTQRIQPHHETFDAVFLYQMLNAPNIRNKIFKQSQGNTQIYVNWTGIENILYYIPEQAEQTKIGEFFKNLDDLIAQNQKKYDKLVNMKKACLDKMFPKDGAGTPEVRFKGFRGEWEKCKIKDVCSISTGKSNTQDRIEDGKYPFYVRSSTIERSNRYLFEEEAVLTVGDGVGTGKVFHYVDGKYDLHQRVYRMFEFNKGVIAKYFYYYFSMFFYNRVMSMTAKTSVDSVRLEMISEMDFIYPNEKEQQRIIACLDNLDNLITLRKTELDKLKNIKKACLDKMFI